MKVHPFKPKNHKSTANQKSKGFFHADAGTSGARFATVPLFRPPNKAERREDPRHYEQLAVVLPRPLHQLQYTTHI